MQVSGWPHVPAILLPEACPWCTIPGCGGPRSLSRRKGKNISPLAFPVTRMWTWHSNCIISVAVCCSSAWSSEVVATSRKTSLQLKLHASHLECGKQVCVRLFLFMSNRKNVTVVEMHWCLMSSVQCWQSRQIPGTLTSTRKISRGYSVITT